MNSLYPPNPYERRETARKALGRELWSLGEHRDYAWDVGGNHACLLWTERAASDEMNDFLDDHLPPVELFIDVPEGIPTVSFLLMRMLEEDEEVQELRAEIREQCLDDYASNRDGLTIQGHQALLGERNANKELLHQYFQEVKKPLGRVRQILTVCYAEAAWSITDADPSSLDHKQKDKASAEIGELTSEFSFLWGQIKAGTSSEPLSELATNLALKWLSSHKLQAAQIGGLEHYLSQRDRVIEEAIPVFYRWSEQEKIVQRSLAGKPLTIEGKSVIEHDGRTKHIDNEQWVRDQFKKLSDSGSYRSQTKLISDLQEVYCKTFGTEISSRTVRRYIQ